MLACFRHLLQLIALSALAFGQPVLGKLGANPDFFIVRQTPHLDFFYLAFALILLIPSALLLVELVFLFLDLNLDLQNLRGLFFGVIKVGEMPLNISKIWWVNFNHWSIFKIWKSF